MRFRTTPVGDGIACVVRGKFALGGKRQADMVATERILGIFPAPVIESSLRFEAGSEETDT